MAGNPNNKTRVAGLSRNPIILSLLLITVIGVVYLLLSNRSNKKRLPTVIGQNPYQEPKCDAATYNYLFERFGHELYNRVTHTIQAEKKLGQNKTSQTKQNIVSNAVQRARSSPEELCKLNTMLSNPSFKTYLAEDKEHAERYGNRLATCDYETQQIYYTTQFAHQDTERANYIQAHEEHHSYLSTTHKLQGRLFCDWESHPCGYAAYPCFSDKKDMPDCTEFMNIYENGLKKINQLLDILDKPSPSLTNSQKEMLDKYLSLIEKYHLLPKLILSSAQVVQLQKEGYFNQDLFLVNSNISPGVADPSGKIQYISHIQYKNGQYIATAPAAFLLDIWNGLNFYTIPGNGIPKNSADYYKVAEHTAIISGYLGNRADFLDFLFGEKYLALQYNLGSQDYQQCIDTLGAN